MTTRVACVQSDVAFNDPKTNASKAIDQLKVQKDAGVNLAIFPEAYLTGYVVENAEDAKKIALHLENDKQLRVTNANEPVSQIQQACQDLKIHAIVGLIATDGFDVYNATLLFTPDGTIWRYYKTHLPILGVDRFVVPGWDLPVFETEIGNIGMLICYDLRIPEAARILALKGADIVALPTNWPVGAEMSPEHHCPCRAAENRVFVAACNRVGTENGASFIGQSGIFDVTGKLLTRAGADEEVISADIDVEQARNKRTVIEAGVFELDIFGSRRPTLYDKITKS